MRLSLFRFALALAGGCLLATPCFAQYTVLPPAGVPIRATATFTVPQNADPAALTFTMEGELYTNADDVNPGDNSGPEITGQMLATNGSAPGNGLELHGLLPPDNASSPRPDVLDVDIFTTYTGGLRVDSITPMPFSLVYTPWNVTQIAPIAGYAQGFRFTSDGVTQPPINFNKFFGLFSLSLADPSDPTDLYSALFGIRGYSTPQPVPEPGTLALLIGSALSGSLLCRSHRKKSVH